MDVCTDCNSLKTKGNPNHLDLVTSREHQKPHLPIPWGAQSHPSDAAPTHISQGLLQCAWKSIKPKLGRRILPFTTHSVYSLSATSGKMPFPGSEESTSFLTCLLYQTCNSYSEPLPPAAGNAAVTPAQTCTNHELSCAWHRITSSLTPKLHSKHSKTYNSTTQLFTQLAKDNNNP